MEGKRGDLADRLDAHMREAVAKENFELAAHYRDMLRTIEQLAEPQKISSSQALNLDVFALRREGSQAAVQLFHQREGRVLDRREFFWEDLDENMSDEEVLSSLVKQYYFLTDFTPDEVHLSRPFEDQEALASFLARRLGKKVSIRVPQRGPRRHFLEMAEKNAQLAFQQRFRTAALSAKAVGEELAALLGVEEPPRRIECFDISNLQGTDSVASLVVWEKGSMKKADYRKFLIKTVPGADDFSSLREVVFRRYRRVLEEKQTLPDLILVDGGLGQLHAAAAALDELNLPTHPLASLAKKEEILFVRGSESEPIGLPRHSPLLRLFQQIRDESHRFALTFHRQRRRKRTLITALTRIPGVGNQSSQLLLKKIGSLQQIREASLAELNRHLNPALARRVYLHFHPETEKDPENPGGS
jgi:excinuclease ABC subunit C